MSLMINIMMIFGSLSFYPTFNKKKIIKNICQHWLEINFTLQKGLETPTLYKSIKLFAQVTLAKKTAL